jgi:uncharacterized protein involved in outer membrane biogenesis
MKLLAKIATALLLLVIISVLAVVAFVLTIDPNKLKPILIQEVKARTGYQLQIDGPLSWSFYPHLSVKIEHMTLQLPNQTTPFMDVSETKVATDLSQLLRGRQVFKGDVTVSKLRFIDLHAEQVRMKVVWQHQVLNLPVIHASMYGGTLQATAEGRSLSAMPRWAWEAEWDQIQMLPLLQDINGPNAKLTLSGLAHMKFKGETQGLDREQMLSNLNGHNEFSIQNGTVQGMDINYLIQTADALINKQAVTPPLNLNQTAFTSLTGKANIERGIVDTHDLLLVSSTFLAKGDGRLNLMNQALQLQLQIKSQATLGTQWEIPILISGDITRPNVSLDRLELEKQIAKEEIEKAKTKASEFINKHIPGKTGEYLQNLLGK